MNIDWKAESKCLVAVLEAITHDACVVVSTEFGESEPEDTPHCVLRLDQQIDKAREALAAYKAATKEGDDV